MLRLSRLRSMLMFRKDHSASSRTDVATEGHAASSMVPRKAIRTGRISRDAPDADLALRNLPATLRMRISLKYILIFTTALCGAVSSCSRPSYIEEFVRTSDRDAYGRYEFTADMSDSLSSYNISLIAAFSSIDKKFNSFRSMPMQVAWESPDGRLYEGRAALARKDMRDSSYFDKILSSEFAQGLLPVNAGVWKMYVKVPEDSLKKYGMTGVGIRIDRIPAQNIDKLKQIR